MFSSHTHESRCPGEQGENVHSCGGGEHTDNFKPPCIGVCSHFPEQILLLLVTGVYKMLL